MQRTNEIKSIMRQLRDSNSVNESLKLTSESDSEEVTSTENDASESDLILARLEDILSRFEKVIAMADGEPAEDEEPSDEEEPAEDEESVEDEEPSDEEEPAEDEEDTSADESLERRIANLERRFTESRRRQLRMNFKR